MLVTRQPPPARGATVQPLATAGNQLHRKLSSFGVLLLTLSCLSPVFSIYGIGSDVLLHAGTGAAGVFICGIADHQRTRNPAGADAAICVAQVMRMVHDQPPSVDTVSMSSCPGTLTLISVQNP